MAILIVSDSHGLVDELLMIVERHQHEVNTFIHCGDSELSINHPALTAYHVVKGNCDFLQNFRKS